MLFNLLHMHVMLSTVRQTFERARQAVVSHPVHAVVLFSALAISGATAFASSGGEAGHAAAISILWIAVVLLFAKLGGLVEKFGQPAVLGELVIGMLLGNLFLVGINTFEAIKHDEIILFLAELGVIILLFQIGLESNMKEMKKVGMNALIVALIGSVLPFVLGTYVVGPWLLPGLSQNAYLFLGAAMTATSVGITARVFKDLGKLKMREAQIVLGAAVFDDVIGLIILAVVTAIATIGAVTLGGIGVIIAKAIGFLVGALFVGQLSAPLLGKAFSKIQTGVGMKFTLAISFALIFAYVAGLIGLAPIVGAFAAGLVLDPVHFRYFKDPKVIKDVKKAVKDESESTKKRVHAAIEPHAHRHIEDLIEPLAYFLVPIFFVITGMGVSLEALANAEILLTAAAITVVAIVGKYVSGIAAGKVNKHIVGVGMVPRGEVGLIFAAIGQGLGVLSEALFSVIVVMVVVTTLIAPPALAWLLKREGK